MRLGGISVLILIAVLLAIVIWVLLAKNAFASVSLYAPVGLLSRVAVAGTVYLRVAAVGDTP
jgi:hypothetical protein